jgi:ribosomal protein S7
VNLKLAKKSIELTVRDNFKKTLLATSVEGTLSSAVLNKFINCLLVSGKRSVVEVAILKTFLKIRNYLILNKSRDSLARFNEEPLAIFMCAIRNIIPTIGLRNYRGPQNTTHIISYLPEYRRIRLALRWLKDSARALEAKQTKKQKQEKTLKSTIGTFAVAIKKVRRPFADLIAVELLKASIGLGKAILKKTELHKRAYAQRAYLKVKL